MIFWAIFLGFLLDILITCIVRVLPPLTILPALMLPIAALMTATGLTP